MRIFWVIVSCLYLQISYAQTELTSSSEVWWGYITQSRLSEKWGIWADFHFRTREQFVTKPSLWLGRIGLTYIIQNKFRATHGYAYFSVFPDEGHANISRPEHRIWQQLQWNKTASSVRILHRIRIDERFRKNLKNDDMLGEGHTFTFRPRYQIQFQFPLGEKGFEKGSLQFVASEELLFNFGRTIVYNTLDQNRIFLGLSYQVTEDDFLQFGYMNILQHLTRPKTYEMIHVLRVFYFHNFDFRS